MDWRFFSYYTKNEKTSFNKKIMLTSAFTQALTINHNNNMVTELPSDKVSSVSIKTIFEYVIEIQNLNKQ